MENIDEKDFGTIQKGGLRDAEVGEGSEEH